MANWSNEAAITDNVRTRAATSTVHSKSLSSTTTTSARPTCKHQTHYCPGCGHGIAHKLIAEAIEELGCRTKPSSSAQSAARYSPTTTLMSATSRSRTDALPPPPPASSAPVRTRS